MKQNDLTSGRAEDRVGDELSVVTRRVVARIDVAAHARWSESTRESQNPAINLKPWAAEKRRRGAEDRGDCVVRLLQFHDHVLVGEPREVDEPRATLGRA